MILGNTSTVGSRHLGEELHIVSTNISEIFGRPNMSDFFPKLAWFDLQGVERDMKKQLKMMDEIIESMIEQRTKLNSKMSHDEVCDHEEKKDFSQILLELKNQEDGSPLDITHIKALLLVSKLYVYII
ncbi:putative flavonoid 3'-monooxygenase [Helianthus annuus]|nr:putative flavonoid 3'-monooxygenase [Helianthus annuus]